MSAVGELCARFNWLLVSQAALSQISNDSLLTSDCVWLIFTFHNAVAYQHRVDKAEKKLKDFMGQAEDVIKKTGCATKAVFVTFSTQMERATCEAACPKREPRQSWSGEALAHAILP